mgnify:CR=1 FL=1
MKVLWTTNLIPANLVDKIGVKADVLGGWVEAMAKELKKFNNIELAIVCKCENGESFEVTVDGVKYYSLPYTPSTQYSDIENAIEKIIADFNPDLIHIEGTEFLHAKAAISLGNKLNIPTVASMQGILNGQYSYQCGQLQVDDMILSGNFTEFCAGMLLHLRKTRWYKKRLSHEREVISSAKYILGRTTWDRAHTYSINPDAKYFSCNRVLRKPFYDFQWEINKIERHSIYVGNSYYALKGFHFVVQALPQLIKEYPDIKVYVAGHKPFSDDDKRSFIKKGYGAYLKKLIDELNVGAHIVFTGPLSANDVAERLSKTHAYILCSAVENSPNTLGEAMLIGTPCVASYVGGVPDMAEDGKQALFYRNDDPSLLAWNIKRVFDNDDLVKDLSSNGRERASVTHSPEKNAEQLLNVYKEILAE